MKPITKTVNARVRIPLEDRAWLIARAEENMRSFNAELLFCIAVAKKEIEAQAKTKRRRS